MVGGIIKDFFIVDEREIKSVIKILVEGINMEAGSFCTVNALIPNDAIKFEMIKSGQHIWWHNPNVLITIEECPDIMFDKIGFSEGGYESFYKQKK